MTRYAESTQVSCDRSRNEIERTLVRYGATGFSYGWDLASGKAVVAFTLESRMIKFTLQMPDRQSERFTTTETGRERSESAAQTAWGQAGRQSWRALHLVVKAKLEAVESGITTFDDEFMAHIVMPDGQTLGEHVTPQIVLAYQNGKMPRLLPRFPQRAATEDVR